MGDIATVHKCVRRGCTNTASAQCASLLCSNWICDTCYEERVLQKFGLPALPVQNNPQVACTKKCYLNAQKDNSRDGRRAWDTDTPTREYPNSSEAMLVDWLVVHGNYSKWKGNNNGISKREIQKEIANKLNKKGLEMGIQRERTSDQIGSKIAWCESKFRETKQWIENTGQGIREEMGDESFEQKIEKERFRHYYTLLPIMSERACMGASITTDQYDVYDGDKTVENRTADGDNELCTADGENEVSTPLEHVVFLNKNLQEIDNRSVQPNGEGRDMYQEVEESSEKSSSAPKSTQSTEKRKSSGSTSSVRKMQMESIESVIETLNSNRDFEREERQKALQEQIRHNREMESIETKKARVTVYDTIEKSMNLFLNSQKVYNEMKVTMSLEQIAQAMPSCIKCFDFSAMTKSDRKKFANFYNEWAAGNELLDRIDPDFFN